MISVRVSKELSKNITGYINLIIEKDYEDYPENLKAATVINKGHIQDERITEFRMKRGHFCM